MFRWLFNLNTNSFIGNFYFIKEKEEEEENK